MRMTKRIIAFVMTLAVMLACLCGCGTIGSRHVQRADWADDVKAAVNDFIDLYGNHSKQYQENSYVVSDFDNTASVFDMCIQFLIYQAEVMGYAFTPEELPAILASGIGDMDEDLSRFGRGNGSYRDWISDITNAYSCLYDAYGPFGPEGVDEKTAQRIQSDPMWAEFIAKMLNLYSLIGENETTFVSYPWITYWYTGMTEDEVYSLARKSHEKYRQVETSQKTIETSPEITSRVGTVVYTYTNGVQVTENIREMWQALCKAGIDIWVCTASEGDIIRAAVDEFGLHDYCTGLIGMTPVVVDGKISYDYDYTNGCAWYAQRDGGWERGSVPTCTQTQGIGKTVAVQTICEAEYGCGPLAGFMDSTGDYNFCTEFESLKLVICFNRADRKVTDGGSVIAALAVYQKDELGYDLKKANAAGDTLYVLQGRDENGTRTLRNSNKTLKLGETEEKLFRDEKNQAIYAKMVEKEMTTADIINTFAIKTKEDSPDNDLGFAYGFLDTFDGYHTK